MEAFKNRYNKKNIKQLGQSIKKNFSSFNERAFFKLALKEISQLEMKERVIQIAQSLHECLPGPYKKNIKILTKTLDSLEGFILWPYSYYGEVYGIDDFETSMKFLKEITKKFTSEWGVRPFIENYRKESYKEFLNWTKDKNEHVRRLVSEGTRPNLPWGKKISNVEKNFNKNIKLLEVLKNDSSEYVRRSVANHMNDISWYDSKLVLKTLKRWKKDNTKETNWIIKHSLRSLLKKGDAGALALIGYDQNSKSKVSEVTISKTKLKEGESLLLSFKIKNTDLNKKAYMLDYVIGYQKSNGEISPKVFKLKNIKLEARSEILINKKISFNKVTTRTHYAGEHYLKIQVNGKALKAIKFHLI